jgi:predicted O-methyltransferase YrrM
MTLPYTTSVKNLARHAVTHPTWIGGYARGWQARRKYRLAGSPIAQYQATHTSIADAMSHLGLFEADVEAAVERRVKPELGDLAGRSAQDARTLLLDALTAVVAGLRPDVVVETGVARGLTSTVVLSEMERVGTGKLYSIDLPILSTHERDFVGQAVPPELRHRWHLQLGPSRRLLPALLDRLGTIDVFLHDSDHMYESQLFEYRLAWSRLRPGGVLLSDDLWASRAFIDAAKEFCVAPTIVSDQTQGAVGLIRR